jgi:lipopolysaccharide/colanic/teichoic acid biosynthesis glycosyltransferase
MTRFFDILFSSLAILVLLPFMLPIMLILKLTGEHYIFYRQVRIGRGGKPFNLYKFATMLLNSPNLPGGLYTSKNDPRLLPIGAFLRKTKINELPQLLNILCGQMSVVGYRPTVPEHFNGYPDYAKKILATARPGLTGIGSVVFRNEEEILHGMEDKKSFHQNVIAPYKAALESWYIGHRNMATYFKLIFMTAHAVLRPNSKDWRNAFKDLPQVPSELERYI